MTDETTAPLAATGVDDAAHLLSLAARLHTARGDALAWRAALAACRDYLDCDDVLALPTDHPALQPDELEALAGRVSHCAGHGIGACGRGRGDPVKRRRCAALATHLHEAAIGTRAVLRGTLFEHLQPTWIIDRDGHVHEANAAAKALTRAGEHLTLVAGCLAPVVPGGVLLLRRALAAADGETRLSWQGRRGDEETLLIRPLAEVGCFAASLLCRPPGAADVAPRLVERFGLTARQGELAALLVLDHTLADAARVMGISRHTANEHLAHLRRRAGAADRKALLVLLRRAAHR